MFKERRLVYLVHQRNNGNVRFIVSFLFEFNNTIGEGEEGMIFADSDVDSWVMDSTTLADKDIACFGELTAVNFNAEAFAMGFATVL